MAGYFDAFLFSLASVWDMSKPPIRAKLKGISSFRFVKALRNIAAHHSILAVGALGNKFPRPFSREVNASVGGAPNDSSRLFFRLDALRQILDAVERERPREKKNIDTARAYITEIEGRGNRVYLEDIMAESIQAIDTVLPQT
jgi:hypothetical protein